MSKTLSKGRLICRRCGRRGYGIIRRYGLMLCRCCFRELAKKMGFRKYE